MNENKNMAYQDLWDAAKAAIMGNFIAVNAYIKKWETSQISSLALKYK